MLNSKSNTCQIKQEKTLLEKTVFLTHWDTTAAKQSSNRMPGITMKSFLWLQNTNCYAIIAGALTVNLQLQEENRETSSVLQSK